jgi:hypothetical protein
VQNGFICTPNNHKTIALQPNIHAGHRLALKCFNPVAGCEWFAGALRLSAQLTHVLKPYDDIAVKMVLKVNTSSTNINAPNKAPNSATGI